MNKLVKIFNIFRRISYTICTKQFFFFKTQVNLTKQLFYLQMFIDFTRQRFTKYVNHLVFQTEMQLWPYVFATLHSAHYTKYV